MKRIGYLVLITLAISALAGCGSGQQEAKVVPSSTSTVASVVTPTTSTSETGTVPGPSTQATATSLVEITPQPQAAETATTQLAGEEQKASLVFFSAPN